MANGKALVEGIVYLADKFAGGDKDGVNVVLSEYGDNAIHLYLVKDKTKIFPAAEVDYMQNLGFDYYEADGEADGYQEVRYSYFGISV